MGVARKWNFSTSVGATKFFGVSGDLSEYRGSGITLLGISSLTAPLFPWPIEQYLSVLKAKFNKELKKLIFPLKIIKTPKNQKKPKPKIGI